MYGYAISFIGYWGPPLCRRFVQHIETQNLTGPSEMLVFHEAFDDPHKADTLYLYRVLLGALLYVALIAPVLTRNDVYSSSQEHILCRRAAMPGSKKESHKCSICGQPGHRIEACTLPGAALVRSLKRRVAGAVSLKADKPHTKARTSSTSLTGKQHARQQRAAYSSRSSKRQKTGVRSLKELLDWSPAASNGDAASWLLKKGVVKRPRSCSSCGGRTVQGPLELSRKGRKPHWHWRCASWKCQKRRSFLEDSTFSGLRARIPT